ncbi:MAG TPA: hypothetical protein DCQ93_00190, partial [Bacteroidetes bacterium]|nr:hypothetical protein [Bacteroidota bacterium]
PNGTIAHAAFFSTQWSKPYSTGLGGIAVTRDNELGKKISSLSENAINPSLKERFILKALLTAHNILLNPFTYSLLVRIYRTLSRMKLVVASSENTELEGTDLPKGFLKKMSRTQMTKGVAALRNLKKNIEHRKMVAAQYSQIISELGGTACFKSDSAEHTFLRYSILVEDKEKFMLQAEKLKLEVGDWFVSPLHPVMSSWEKWFYSEGSCPVAENICKQIINLPTHEKINEKYISRIQQLLALQKIY